MHSKIQGHRPFGSGEEDLFRFLPYMDMAAILVMWPGPFEQIFVPPSHRSSKWNLNLIAQWFLRRRCLKSVDDDVRRRPTYPIAHQMSLRLRRAKKPQWRKFSFKWMVIFVRHLMKHVANIMIYNKGVWGQSPQELKDVWCWRRAEITVTKIAIKNRHKFKWKHRQCN